MDLSSPCQLFEGSINGSGYGGLTRGNKTWVAHRYYWVQKFGPIPKGLEVDHLCRVRACVNTDHMELVTHRENMRRGKTAPAANLLKTHCPAGHEYNERNTHIRKASGSRQCRICDSDYHKRKRREARSVSSPALTPN